MGIKVKLEKVRLSFPELFKAKEFKIGDGKPRFSAAFLVKPGSDNDKRIRQAIADAAKETWADKAAKTLKSFEGQKNQYCYTDGDLREFDGYAGNWVLASHSKTRPTVIDRDRAPLDAESGKPYAGCYVNAIVEIYGQTGENPGIRASVSGVQFHSDGDAFGGGRPASAEDFDDLSEGSDDDDLA